MAGECSLGSSASFLLFLLAALHSAIHFSHKSIALASPILHHSHLQLPLASRPLAPASTYNHIDRSFVLRCALPSTFESDSAISTSALLSFADDHNLDIWAILPPGHIDIALHPVQEQLVRSHFPSCTTFISDVN